VTSIVQHRVWTGDGITLAADHYPHDGDRPVVLLLHGGCLSAMVDHCLGVVFYPVIPAGSWVATTEFKLNLLRPVSSGVCVAVADIVSLGKRSGVARIDITNGDKAVCAAQGTVTIVNTIGNAS
jgi:1,4-dihydroxy-2-naphthoyl-CoA hydrolase